MPTGRAAKDLVTVTTSLIVQPGNPECQDRAEIIPCGECTVLVLADGAGGISGGAEAAQTFVEIVRRAADQLRSPNGCILLLQRIDHELESLKDCGETTGVVVVVNAYNIFGASAGDSAAWVFSSDRAEELTRNQHRKPLLGSGQAPSPSGFSLPMKNGALVIASDGLWKYASMEAIRSRVTTRDSENLALRLAQLARLPSGTFQDDVAVITCRIEP